MPPIEYEQDQRSDISLLLRLLHPAASLADIKINENQLQGLWDLGIEHNVSMLIYSRLQSRAEQLSAGASLFLAKKLPAFLGSVARSARQEAEEIRLIDLLQGQGIDACILKGSEIATQIYNDPNSRASSDIDLLVRERDIHEVDRLLVKEGYERYDKTPLIFWLERLHHAAYFNKTGAQIVEMHWSFGIPSFFHLSSDEIWAETEKSGTNRIALLPEMQVIQALMHHHMHSFREIRSLVDLLWIFHVYGNVIEWQHLAARLQKIGLIKTAQITLHQLAALWSELAGRMQAMQKLEGAFRAMDCRIPKMLSTYFRPPLLNLLQNPSFSEVQMRQRRPFLDKLMMRFALDRKSTIWLSFQKSLIPSPRIIKTLYSDKRTWMLPVHYLRFLGWRIKEWFVRA